MATGSASDRLEAALAEQARLGDFYERAIGSAGEFSSFLRLRAASRWVAICQRALNHRRAMVDGLSDGNGNGNGRHPAQRFAASVAGGPAAPGAARALVGDSLAGVLNGEIMETVRLLVSELATNCVQHAGADAAARIDLGISMLPEALRVEVSTAAPPFALSSRPTLPDPVGPTGRGLYLVDSLSRQWGVEPRWPNKVWFEVATAPGT